MSKLKTILFLALGVLVHLGVTLALIAKRITCDMQANCVGMAFKFAETVFGFPLNVITWLLYPHGARATGWFYILVVFNSFVAITIIWFVLVRPFVRRSNMNSATV